MTSLTEALDRIPTPAEAAALTLGQASTGALLDATQALTAKARPSREERAAIALLMSLLKERLT